MKQTELIALGLAGVAVFLIVKAKGGKISLGIPALKTSNATTYDRVTEVLAADGQRFDNGWRYFNDGTSIDQQGNYYKDGALIWTAPNQPAFV